MDACRHPSPRVRIGADERVDLVGCQFESLIPQLPQRLDWMFAEAQSEIFVGEEAADHELHGLLRHAIDTGNLHAIGYRRVI